MTTTGTRVETGRPEALAGSDVAVAWYLYGITGAGLPASLLADADAGSSVGVIANGEPDETAPLQLLECGDIAAVVRPVHRAAFSPEVLEERLRSASDLEAAVRSHNRVIEAVHARHAMLPATFGVLYAQTEDIVRALRSASGTLAAQLHRVAGCDEWALHLYADQARIEEHFATRTPAVVRLREQCATARPGRAYFLERQLRDELGHATHEALVTIAHRAFERVAASAARAQASVVGPAADATGEVEILRAAFLVAREREDAFEAAVRSVGDGDEGLRCECSGPWPPYSFAAFAAEEGT